MPWPDQRYAFADEDRDHGDDHLIDGSRIQKSGDDLAAAHHPDVFAPFVTKASGEGADRFRDEFDAGGESGGRRASRKDVVPVVGSERGAQLDAAVERLPSQNLGIDGARESGQPVESLERRSIRQPVEVAIRSGDVAIRARRDVDDDFPGRHRSSG